jgi:DNA-binding response OmpR family regulator
VRVLVVSEDDKVRLRAVSALLLDEDVEVTEATSGHDARSSVLAEPDRFDLLIVDGDLQPRGGYAMLYDLRARADLTGADPVPAIVLGSREQDRWLAAWAGASELMLKPVDPFELRRRAGVVATSPPPPYGDAGSAAAQLQAAVTGHRR